MQARLKSAVKQGAGYLLTRLGLLDRRHRGRVLVLAYHRVLPAHRLADHAVEPGMYVTDAAFRRQMDFVKAHYDVLSMQEWLESWPGGGLAPDGRYCLITFDDGWRDTFEVAFPILRDLRLPASIFLATGFVGTDEWFWTEKVTYCLMRGDLRRLPASRVAGAAPASPWSALRRLAGLNGDGAGRARRAEEVSLAIQLLKQHPPDGLAVFCEELARELDTPLPRRRACVTWEEVREMSARGIAFGSHSTSHSILPALPAERVREELHGSRQTLESQHVNFAPVFCYPNGTFDARVKALVREAGYRAAVSTRYGLEALTPTDPFAIPRVAIHEDVARTESLLGLRLITAPSPSLRIATAGGAG